MTVGWRRQRLSQLRLSDAAQIEMLSALGCGWGVAPSDRSRAAGGTGVGMTVHLSFPGEVFNGGFFILVTFDVVAGERDWETV